MIENTYTNQQALPTTNQVQGNQTQPLVEKIRSFSPKKILVGVLGILTVSFLLIGLVITVSNTKKDQESRSQASGAGNPDVEISFVNQNSPDFVPSTTNPQVAMTKSESLVTSANLLLKPNGASIIAAEVYLVYHPNQVEIVGVNTNLQTFSKVSQYQIQPGQYTNIRMLLGINKGQDPITANTLLGNIQFKLKPGSKTADIGYTQVKYVTSDSETITVKNELWRTGDDPTTGMSGKKIVSLRKWSACGQSCTTNYTACHPEDPNANQYMCWNNVCQLIACRGQFCTCQAPATPTLCWVMSDNCTNGSTANCKIDPSFTRLEGCQQSLVQ